VPYENDGRTPDGFDCWGLVWYYLNELGVTIPKSYDYVFRNNMRNLLKVTSNAVKNDPWKELSKPENHCVVAFGRNGKITHVGVWLDSEKSVLHATAHGVRCESLIRIRRMRNLEPKFYKWHK
jgi:cell wall-associated NlpC family hydrolase